MVLEAGLTLALNVRHLPVYPPLRHALCQAALGRHCMVHVHARPCMSMHPGLLCCLQPCWCVLSSGTKVSMQTSMSCIILCSADVRAWAW